MDNSVSPVVEDVANNEGMEAIFPVSVWILGKGGSRRGISTLRHVGCVRYEKFRMDDSKNREQRRE